MILLQSRGGFRALLVRNQERLLTTDEQQQLREFLHDGDFRHLGESEGELNELIDKMNTETLCEDEFTRLKHAGQDREDWVRPPILHALWMLTFA